MQHNKATSSSKRVKVKIPFKTYLTYLLLVSLLVTGITFSRYITSGDGTSTATVGVPNLDATISVQMNKLYPGAQQTVNFQVKNFNDAKITDVALAYEVKVISSGNLPLTFALTSPDGSTTNHALTQGEGNVWSGGTLGFAQTTHSYVLTISWSSSENDVKYAEEIDAVTIMINAVQVD